ncbi:MAG: hypothetical protein LBQ97_04325 [Fusobacteriaceae bacterium]|jgi:predicted HTH transcriptional regulator|nr:hypothetical protein [Fusobacteriaceae bacterium]
MLNIGERSGSGIPSIYEVWENEGFPPPILKEDFNPDRTTLSLVLKKTSEKNKRNRD